MGTSTRTRTTRPRKNPAPAAAGYRLTSATEAALLRKAESLGVLPAVVVEIAVAQWLQQA